MRFLNQKLFIYTTLAAAPLYLVKFVFFQVPTNLLELFIFINVIIWLRVCYKKKLKKIWFPLPWQIVLSIGFIIFGVILSIFANNAIFTGLGILKSWFVLPLFFAYILYSTLNNSVEISQALFSVYFSNITVAIAGITYKILDFVTYDGRLSAFYASPNYLALYLAPGVLLGFYFFAQSLTSKASPLIKVLFGSSLAVILLVFFYTYSYASWLAVLLSFLVTCFFYLPKKRFIAILVCFFTLIVVIFSQIHSPKFTDLIHTSERSSFSSRLMIWKASEKMLAQNLILGIGPGNFQTKYLALQPSFPLYLEWAVPQPHNIFLAFWLQTGLIGFIGFIFLISFVFHSLLHKIKLGATSGLLFSFFLYIILHGLVDTPFWKNDLAFLFWVFVALYAVLLKFSLKIKTE